MNSKKKKSSNKNLLSVIVPVYNEEEVLPDFLSVLASATKTFKQATEVIFVDDGSSDSSVNILKNYVSKVKNYSLVSLKRNLGQTIALLTGIYQAHGDVIVTIDADLQNDPFDIPHLIDELDPTINLLSVLLSEFRIESRGIVQLPAERRRVPLRHD